MRTLPTDKTWRKYGKREPYFGVFGQNQYLSKNFTKETHTMVIDSGRKYVEELFELIQDKVCLGFKADSILDYGCGPGRMLIPFSKFAGDVVGMDISNDMLLEARKNCEANKVFNVSFLMADDKLSKIKGKKFDLVHSFIVLQHLNIKRGEKLIQMLIDHINPDGVGALHITYHDSYPNRKLLNFFRFRVPFLWFFQRLIHSKINAKPFHSNPQMQMNSYNLNRIHAILQQNNIKEVICTYTNHYEYLGISIYFKKTPEMTLESVTS